MSEEDFYWPLDSYPVGIDQVLRDAVSENGAEPDLTPFPGLSHAEVLAMEFPPERMLIENLIPIGAVGTIAGVPETHKSWSALTLSTSVATGQGGLFGFSVASSGPVGYFWQDDSTREEAERVKLYDSVRGDGSNIPIRWFLNEGLQLPRDLDRLVASITHYGFVLVVLDSFYNVLFGMDLKDEAAEQVVSMLKSQVCDATGATVLIVDHMPWATDQNRKRLRAYGGVFKGAAVRFGIYLDAVGNKIWAEGRGNNITGFKRQLAEWNEETLELELLGTADAVSGEEYEQRILEYLTENGATKTADLSKNVKGAQGELVAARGRLLDSGQLVRERDRTSKRGYVWKRLEQAEVTSTRTDSDEVEQLQLVRGTTSTPLRGSTSDVPVALLTADDVTQQDPDDGIPF